jgi:alpha-amylase
MKTVSQSEAGFEKIMQAVEVCVAWTVPDDECTLKLHLTTAASAP